jgi:predicted dehydrogenase
MKSLRIGVVGLGWVAGAHIGTFKHVKGAEVVGVSSRRRFSAADLEAKYGIPLKPYDSYEEMLKDPSIDVIDICTPHPMHAAQTIAAANAGKHLIIEKPLAIDYKDTVAMRKAIGKAGVQSCVCFELRFSRQAMAIRSAIDKGLLGDLHYGECDYYHGIGPWYGQYAWNIKKDFGGSSLLTAGCHAMDLLLFYMPGEVEEVMSYQARSKSRYFKSYEYATTSVTIVKYKDGRAGKVASVVDCLQPYYFHMHLVGSNGSVLDDKFTATGWEGMGKDKWSQMGVPLVDSGDVADHPYQPQFQAFVDALKKNKPMPKTDFETAFQTHRVCFAADLSAEAGRPVKLSELKVDG